MAFDLAEAQLQLTEQALACRLPSDYREAMKQANGGEAETAEDEWELYPIKDTTDKKRLSRSCHHILHETAVCQQYGNFPTDALAIAHNGFGDQMVLLKAHGQYQDTVYLWRHETGELQQLAERFSEIDRL